MNGLFKTISRSVMLLAMALPLTFAAGSVSVDGVWSSQPETQIATRGQRYIQPNSYRTFSFDQGQFTQRVSTAGGRVMLPLADGSYQEFDLFNAPVMAKDLAARYPEIRTWAGQSTDGSGAWARIDLTPLGFHGMIRSAEGLTFIDPYQLENGKAVGSDYLVYAKADIERRADQHFQCTVHDHKNDEVKASPITRIPVGDELRTYRLAVAATGEYTAFHGGTVAAGQAAIVTAINRVTGIYETELAIRMVLIGNNDSLVFTNAATDGYTNSNGVTMLGQNQAKLDSVIGSANYDIGHVFSTGGGGIAGLGVVCRANNKARGVTGLSQPIGDPFYVDFVAHEIGHQFGAPHSFNGTASACAPPNRSGSTAYEPGSGSTIMAYAGICGAHNIANNSDAYFHTTSFDSITNYTVNGSGRLCPQETATGNAAPVVEAGDAKAVPAGTPIRLSGSAVDPDGDPLTYRWEQFDLGPGGAPNNPTDNAPAFRSFPATASNTRLLPRLVNILNDSQSLGEVVIDYTRDLTFRLTALDNRLGGGGVDHDTVGHSVIDTGSPFEVTSQNSVVIWPGGSTQTVTWNVANTTAFPISCSQVNVLLSDDGGQSFGFVLAKNTANDGSEDIVVPEAPSNSGRVMVECANNIFFDINNANIVLEPAPNPDFELSATPELLQVCAPDDGVANIAISSIGAFTGPVDLSVSGVPSGASSAFSPDPANGGSSSVLTVSNTGAATAGVYPLVVQGVGAPGTRTTNLTLELALQSATAPVIDAPLNGATDIPLQPTLTWQPAADAVDYLVELATDAGFTNLVESAAVTATSYSVNNVLNESTTYFWRVFARNACGDVVSSVATFSTVDPPGAYCSSPGVAIPDNDVSGVNDVLTIPDLGSVIDLDVTLVVTHASIGNIVATLTNVATGTQVEFVNRVGGDFLPQGCPFANMDATFDDEADMSQGLACDTTAVSVTGSWLPREMLSAFDGENFAGDWQINVVDDQASVAGTLAQWCVTIVAGPPTGTDTDGDGIFDDTDNCTNVENPSQVDADNDGFGNQCDPDLNNDLIVNFLDLAAFQGLFLSTDPVADFNLDGNVNFLDLVILTNLFLQPPGPSGVAP